MTTLNLGMFCFSKGVRKISQTIFFLSYPAITDISLLRTLNLPPWGYVIYSPKKNKGNRAKWKINGFNEFELFRSMDGFALHLGSFSNEDGDGNDNGKKAIG